MTNAGEYTITYTVESTSNYDGATATVSVTVNKQVINVANVTWNYTAAFTYNGAEQSVALNNVPALLTAQYTNNSKIDAGTYTASVEFEYDTTNYVIEGTVASLTWTINKQVIDLSALTWDYDGAITYDGQEHEIKIKNLPVVLTVTYIGNKGTTVGEYTAEVATVTVSDTTNYETTGTVAQLSWEIVGIPTHPLNKSFELEKDGIKVVVTITEGTLPASVAPDFNVASNVNPDLSGLKTEDGLEARLLAAYDIYFKNADDSAYNVGSDLGCKFTVTVTLTEEQRKENLQVIYIKEDGTIEVLDRFGLSEEGDIMEFDTNHFSIYGIVEMFKPTEKNYTFLLWIIIILACLVVILTIALIYTVIQLKKSKNNAAPVPAVEEPAAEEEAQEPVVEEPVVEEEPEAVEELIEEEAIEEVAEEVIEEEAVEEETVEEVAEEFEEEVEEVIIYVDEDGNEISAEELALLQAQEAEEEAEEEEDDDDDDDETEEEALEAEEEVVEEAKEKGIIMPEVQILDEDGNPKKIKRKFNTRMMFAPYETKEFYNEIKNYLLMYRAKGRYSARCETFRYKGLIAKVSLGGKSIKVCLALDPALVAQTPKYRFKDVSNKKQYAEVPVMIKVRSARGLKYFKELVDIMMANRLVKPKRNFVPTNYIASLIPNGEAILGTLGLSTDYLQSTINVRGIPAEMPSDLHEYLPIIVGEDLVDEELEAAVYLDTLCNHFNDGDEVTLEKLKELHIVNKGNVLRVKARGTLDRKLIIYAETFDDDALKMLLCTNCTAVKIIR